MAHTAEAGLALEVSTATETGAFGGKRTSEECKVLSSGGLTSAREAETAASPAAIGRGVKVLHATSGMHLHCFVELTGEGGEGR